MSYDLTPGDTRARNRKCYVHYHIDYMIFIGLGANLPSEAYGPPEATCEAALGLLEAGEVRVLRRSRWYRSNPLPPSGQPWFVNGVAEVETALEPAELLTLMHRIEAETGRVRGEINGPRVLDLDLLDYDGRLSPATGGGGRRSCPIRGCISGLSCSIHCRNWFPSGVIRKPERGLRR